MLRRACSILLAGHLLAAPTLAFAAWDTPSTLFANLEWRGPVRFDGELHASGWHPETGKKMWLSAWVNGASEGKDPTDPGTKMKTDVTVDIELEEGPWVRMRLGVRLHEGTLYVKLGSLEGKYDDEFIGMAGWFAQKKWATFPMEEIMAGDEVALDDGMWMDSWDEMFDVHQDRFSGGQTYKLTLKPEFREMLGFMAADMAPVAGDARGDAAIKIDTNGQGVIRFQRAWLEVTSPVFSLGLVFNAQHQTMPVYVDVPTETIDGREWMTHFPDDEFFPMHDATEWMHAPTWEREIPDWREEDVWEDDGADTSDWENRWLPEMPADECDPAHPDFVRASRLGWCGLGNVRKPRHVHH